MTTPAPVPFQMLVPPYGCNHEMSLYDKITGGFAQTDANVSNLGKELLRSQADILVGVERNGLVTNNAVERNGGDTRATVIQQSGIVAASVADSRSLIQNSVSDAKAYLTQNDQAILSAVERNASENRATTYTQASEGRIQSSNNFAAVRDLVAKEAASTNLNTSLQTSGLESSVQGVGTANAIAAKDIQILSLQNKSDMLMAQCQASANARLDTLSGTERVLSRVAAAELESFKQKEFLSAQICRSELEQVKSTAALLSKMQDCCCEVKGRIDERALETGLLIKANEESRLKDQILSLRVGRRGGWDDDYGYGHGGGFLRGRDGRDGRDARCRSRSPRRSRSPPRR